MIWLLLYALLLFALSFYSIGKKSLKSATKQEVYESFFINNRQSSAKEVGFSIVASCVGGSATLGMAGLAWQVGTPAFWWLGTSAVGLCVLAIFLASKVRESGAYTLPEMVKTYLGPQARPLTSIIIILAWLAITSAQFSAMAALILPLMPEALAFLPSSFADTLARFDAFTLSLLLGASIVIIYACIGGQAAVIKSDILQYIILMLALILALALLTLNINEQAIVNPLSVVPLEFVNADFTLSKFSYFLLILGGSYVVCPMLFARLYSAKNSNAAKKGTLLAVFGLIITAVLIVCLGIICRAFVSVDMLTMTPEKVLTTVLFEQLPPWARIFAFLGIFSALISSVDSSLITAATICSNDILRKKSTNICRFCIVLMGIGGVILALSGKGILQLLLMANDIYVCGVVAPVFMGMTLHKCYKLQHIGMCAAIIVGGTFGLVAATSGNSLYSYLGVLSAIILSLLSIKKRQKAVCAH